MVECDLAKVEVAGSNPVSRSRFPPQPTLSSFALPASRVCFFGRDLVSSLGASSLVVSGIEQTGAVGSASVT